MAKMTRCGMALLLLLGMAAPAVLAVTDGLLPNGNFEERSDKSQLMNGTVVTGRYSIPRWEISGFVEFMESGQKQGEMILPVPEGDCAVRLGNDASIRQLISVTRHAEYSITFSAARTCAQAEKLNVSVAPSSGVLPVQTVYTATGWDSYSWAFKAKHSAVLLSIHNPDAEDDPACGPIIDSVAIKTLRSPHATKNNMMRNGDLEEGPYIFPGSACGVLVPPSGRASENLEPGQVTAARRRARAAAQGRRMLAPPLVPPMDEDDFSPLPGWMIMSDTKVVKYVDAPQYRVPHGARAVEMVAGREAALVQEVHGTVPGRSYRLMFSVGDAADGCADSMVVEAYAARANLRVLYESQGTGGHQRAELDFVAVGNSTRVAFQSMNYHMKPDGTLCGPVVDDVSLVSVHKHAARRLFM